MEESILKQSTLASYSMMKALTDSNDYRSSYEILAEFIRYIIVDRKWHKFSITDVSNELMSEFGFDNIPIPVIRTSLKQIKECKRNQGNYYISSIACFNTDSFKSAKKASSVQSESITLQLDEYVRNGDYNEINLDSLHNSFIKYLLDDAATIEAKYSDIISKFIVKNDNNEEFKRQISQIREGSILYCGLAYNISELGSITSDLTLYLDTEVLFNIMGFNGVLYKKIAEDFLNQVKFANSKKKRIKLRFFNEVKVEVESFFKSAENALRGRGNVIVSTAMKSIINGCETIGDIRIKEADFFYKLKTLYSILPDDKESYYSEQDHQYNIETVPDGYPKDQRSFEAVKYISHINKLRKGEHSFDYTSCKFLLVTETKRIQEISNSMRESRTDCGFALPTSTLTNILWFKLGSGFSNREYPINTDASYKARGILSGELFNSIIRVFEETKKQYNEGLLDRDQVVNRIILLREKNRTPDEVSSENFDELLDFSPEYIDKYEEGIKQNQVQLQEKQRIIDSLVEDSVKREEKSVLLADNLIKVTEERDAINIILDDNKETIRKQDEELTILRREKEERNSKRELCRLRGIFIFGSIKKLLLFGIFTFVIVKILGQLPIEWQNAANLCSIGISILIAGGTIYEKDWKKYTENKNKIKDNIET